MPNDICSVPTCARQVLARGHCNAHWKRLAEGRDLAAPIQVKKRHPYAGMKPDEIAVLAANDIAPTEAGCIEWPYGRTDDGYPRVHWHGRRVNLHRVSWEVATGLQIPAGLIVRHTCDNPPCFNPQHLLVGTFKDNTADSVERGRNNHGERHHFTPFTDDDVRRIRASFESGQSIRSLARQTGVQRNAIANIVHRKSWKHVA